MDRRAFVKKVAKIGWVAPVILTVMSNECRGALSGGAPSQMTMPERRNHKPLLKYHWDQVFGDGERHY